MTRTKTLIFITFLIISISTNAQKIEGIYRVDDINLIVADIGMTFSFEQDGTFRKTLYEHLGKKTISGGNYELVGDTLKLNYIRLKATPPNPINILKRERLKSSSDTSFNSMFSNIKVCNSEGEPQPGVILVLQNKKKKPVMAFMSDSAGKFPNLSLYDNYVTDLQFSFLGHQEAYLKTDSLFNFQTDIEVRLNDSSLQYENTEQSFSYLIKKPSQEKIELIPLKGDDKDKLTMIKIE